MNAKERERRRFLKEGAALAGLALGATQQGITQTHETESHPTPTTDEAMAYGVRSRYVTSARKGSGTGEHNPFGRLPTLLTPLQDSMGIITASSLHHSWAHGYVPPDIDPAQHRLLIHGMVERPMTFTMAQLKRFPSVSRIHYIECNANSSPDHRGPNAETFQEMHGRTSCCEWTGVLLSVLLREVGVQKGGTWLVAEGSEPAKYEASPWRRPWMTSWSRMAKTASR